MVEVLLIVLLVISVGRALFLRRTFEAFAERQAALPSWRCPSSRMSCGILEFGDGYRFLIPIELLSFTLIFHMFSRRCEIRIGWKPLVSVGTIVLALVCVVSEQPMNSGASLGMVGNLFQRNRAKSAVAPVGGLSHAWEQSI